MSGSRIVVVAAAVALAATSCSSSSTSSSRPGSAEPAPPTTVPSVRPTHADRPDAEPQTFARPTTGLVRASDCTVLVRALKREALHEVTPFGLRSGWDQMFVHGPVVYDGVATVGSSAGSTAPVPMRAAATGGGTTAGSAGAGLAVAHSTTNNQEADVDEPDIAKTDGRVLAVLRHDDNQPALSLLDVTQGQPRVTGGMSLPSVDSDAQLFLTGERVLVVGSTRFGLHEWRHQPAVTVLTINISDPAHPALVRNVRVRGAFVDARMIAGEAVLVTQSSPRLRFHWPRRYDRDHRQRTLAYNRAVVASSDLRDWLPAVHVGDRRQGIDCGTTYRTAKASGLGAVTVVSVDATGGEPDGRTTVFGNAGTVYASDSALYIATNDWTDRRALRTNHTLGVRTQVHGFDLSDPSRPAYVGTGMVPGTVLNKYSMSEEDGYLRVATTVGDALPPPGEGRRHGRLSDNLVTVLKPQFGRLVQVGQVDGLGRGERIYSVRYEGPIAYVVTFRALDPLFVLDLSDPTHPVRKGALHVTGFSSYLHPLDDGLLLGLGGFVDRHLAQRGVQASVFDVSNVDKPQLRGRVRYADSYTAATDDFHQFLWWPAKRIAVLPLDIYRPHDNRFSGDIVLHVGKDGSITEQGRLAEPGKHRWWPGFERALVIGDLLYTVSDRGVLTSDIESLSEQRWLPFH